MYPCLWYVLVWPQLTALLWYMLGLVCLQLTALLWYMLGLVWLQLAVLLWYMLGLVWLQPDGAPVVHARTSVPTA